MKANKLLWAVLGGMLTSIVAAHAVAGAITVGLGGGYDHDNIQAAINAAVGGDTVLIADGIYTGPGNRDIDFLGKPITVQSVNGPANCIVDCQGSPGNHHRGFFFHTGETNASILDGLTIQNGYHYSGGGIGCGSSPTIRNCLVQSNGAGRGGGVYVVRGSMVFEENVVRGNLSDRDGGGLCLVDCDARVSRCTVSGNEARYQGGSPHGLGGGLRILGGNCSVVDCLILGNRASDDGGGISAEAGAGTITRNVIVGNYARTCGGGLELRGTGHEFTGNLVANNTAGAEAGGVRVFFHAAVGGPVDGNVIVGNSTALCGGGLTVHCMEGATLRNNLVAGNTASIAGGGIYNRQDSVLRISNSTVVGNNASFGAGMWSETDVPPEVRNCIFWGPPASREQIYTTQSVDVAYCDVRGGCAGEGNIDGDPQFVACRDFPALWEGPSTPPSGLPRWEAVVYDPDTFQTKLTGGSWTPGELAGKLINPDAFQWLQFYIVDNDETSIIVWGDASGIAEIQDQYYICDYHLTGNSPCIDAGCDAGVYDDLDGNARPLDFLGVDHNGPLPEFEMGAYEVTFGPADANMDGCVDGLDYVIWSNNYEPGAGGKNWLQGDLNGDGIVDGLDYVIWSNHYDEGCPAIPGAVAEPSSALVLILGICALGRRRVIRS